MKRTSNNRNLILTLLTLGALFGTVIAGASISRSSFGEIGKHAVSEKQSVAGNVLDHIPVIPDKTDISNNIPLTQGPITISPDVISGGGGSSSGGAFTLDDTLGETSATEQQVGGNFTFDGGFWNMPQDFSIPTGGPPTISAVPVIRTAGAGASNSAIANVSDPVDPANTLTVTVNGGSGATQNGVTVNNISVSVAGVVTADVVAATGASDASFTLTVTNSAMLSSISTLPVIVLSSCPGSGTWTQQAKNTASDGGTSDQFGVSVAISGDTAIVGAYDHDAAAGTNVGSAYIFTRNGTIWTQQQELTASDGAQFDKFGISVAISGDTAIVGAFLDDTPGGTDAGSAYVFTRSGSVWTEQQNLTASDGAAGDYFGSSVAITGDTAIVGAPFDDTAGGTNAGSTYVFTRSGNVWTQQQKLTASDGAMSDVFGDSVAISGDTVIVAAADDDSAGGTDAGSAYIFTRNGSVWTQQQKLTASDGAAFDYFGVSVAISGDTAIVGAYYDDTAGGTDAGSAYIYTRNGSVWTQQQKLTASDGETGDYFGSSVAISGDTAIVGADDDDPAGVTNAGSAYFFTRSGSVWTQQQKLTASDSGVGDSFGGSVAISGDTIIVGAYADDTVGGTDAGSSYIFTKNCAAPTPTPSATPPSSCIPNMISWWPGEGNALDVVSSNNGTLQNGVGFASGEVGQAFSFDGVDDSVFVGNPPSLNVTSITTEAWVKTNSFPDGTIKNVVAKWGFDATVDSYLLGLINSGGVIHVFGGIGDGVTGDPGIAGGTVSTNTWTHIAMTYDSASGTNRLYLNGAQVASRVRPNGIFQTVTNVYIGREDSGQGRFFNGLIDEPSVYSRALSATEIQAIYNAGSLGKCNGASTATPTNTPTATPTVASTPALGNYANTTVQLSSNTIVTPDAAPTNTSRMTVATSTSFKGKLEGSPATGIVRVTDAHPAGVYTVTVKAFDSGGMMATKTFTLTVTTPPTCDPVTFAPTSFGAGSGPRSIAVGDFNGDGKQDLVTANSSLNNVSVLLQNGTGGFDPPVNFVTGTDPEAVAVGDLNGDGKQDIAVANKGSNNVSILLGDGAGELSAPVNFAVGANPDSLAIGEFNNDGKPDIVAANYGLNNGSTDTVSVLLGDGAGGFGVASNYGVSNLPYSVVVGDFNGDGNQDIAVASNASPSVSLSVLLGNGLGVFSPAVHFGTGITSTSLAVGDFNGDGKQDIVTANQNSANVSILLGDGGGSFSGPVNFNVGTYPMSVVVGDFNGDGKQDIATANQAASDTRILLGDGNGGFGAYSVFTVGSIPVSLVVGDFNGDGMQDLATANYSGNAGAQVTVLLRQCVYANKTMQLGANTTITPLATPSNAARLTVATSTSFKGKLEGSPTTGVVRVTDAHPAGMFPVTVTGFDGAGAATTTSTFTLTVTTPALCNQATFAAATVVPVGGNPTSVAIGDFNGDKIQDFAVANFGGYVSILLGNGNMGIGDGTFGSTTDFNVGAAPLSVAVGDFNGDGNQDLVTANYNSSNISVLLGTGTGSFSAHIDFSIGTAPETVAVGDFNGDGKQDLVTANSASTTVSILLGDGTGSFGTATNFPAPNNPPSVVVGDFNGDGKQDLATNEASNIALVLMGNGTGSFGGPTYYGGGTSFAIAIGDFNGDGKQDLASATGGSDVRILLGNGSGAFSGSGIYPVGLFPKSVAVGDFDNDGDQDIATVNKNSNNVSLLLGNGAGSFSGDTGSPFSVGQSPNSVAVGDFNSDANLDLVVANSTSGNLSILKRQCSAPTSTQTATATPTNSPTATPTGTPVAITGTVTYGNAAVPPKFISNVLITGMGSPIVTTTTAAPGVIAGQYSLTGFGAGSYTVTPTKTGGANGGITSFDAARIAQHVAGLPLPQLTGNQLVVADVSGNGVISSFDAGEIAKFAAGPPFAPPGIGLTGTWIFSPLNRTYPAVTTDITGENYAGLLMGEVSGNWNDTGARPANGPERSTAVTAPRLVTPADNEVIIPIGIQGAANKGIISYQFDLRYDPTVIQPQADPVDLVGTVSRGLSAVANPNEPGLLRVVMYGPLPIDGNGLLLNLRFTAIGAPGTVSPLTWENIMLNEGDPGTMVTDGQVELSAAAPNQAEISGRLLNTMGQGVPNARVTLTDSTGQNRSVASNGFGVYRFGGLKVGQTYTISVESRALTFTPLTVSVTDQLVNVDMIAGQ